MMVSINKYLFIFLIASPRVVRGSDAASSKQKAFVPRRVLPKPALVPARGGAEPVIDPALAGKLFTGASLIQGMLLQLAPSQQLEFYGMQGRTDATHALCADFGSNIVATGIVSYLSLIEKTTSNKAVGSAFLYLFLWTLVTLLADRQGAIGATNAPIYARLVVFGLGAVTTLFYDQDNKDSVASKLAKAVVYFRLIDGIFTVFNPDKLGDTWGLSLKETPAEHYMMRALGFSITWVSVMMVTLLHGIESPKAVGYGGIGVMAYFVCQKFITKEWEEVGMPVGKNYAWMIFIGTMTVALMSLVSGGQ